MATRPILSHRFQRPPRRGGDGLYHCPVTRRTCSYTPLQRRLGLKCATSRARSRLIPPTSSTRHAAPEGRTLTWAQGRCQHTSNSGTPPSTHFSRVTVPQVTPLLSRSLVLSCLPAAHPPPLSLRYRNNNVPPALLRQCVVAELRLRGDRIPVLCVISRICFLCVFLCARLGRGYVFKKRHCLCVCVDGRAVDLVVSHVPVVRGF